MNIYGSGNSGARYQVIKRPEPHTCIYIWCIHSIFGREITQYTVLYGVYIRFWQFGRPLPGYRKARTIYVHIYIVFLAGKSPNIRSYTVCLYGSGNSGARNQVMKRPEPHTCIYMVHTRYFWQGNHRIYCPIYGVYILFWPTLVTWYKLHESHNAR